MPVGQKISPLTGENSKQNIQQSIDKKEPHKSEMPTHTFSKAEGDMKGFIKAIRKKSDQYFITPANLVHTICPVNKQPAPYHASQNGEVEPMKPPDG